MQDDQVFQAVMSLVPPAVGAPLPILAGFARQLLPLVRCVAAPIVQKFAPESLYCRIFIGAPACNFRICSGAVMGSLGFYLLINHFHIC
jgi:hypothetical protein